MMQQTPNEQRDWRRELDELEDFEDFENGTDPLNDDSWNIICRRQNADRNRKRKPFYWAAATILGAIGLFWIVQQWSRGIPAEIRESPRPIVTVIKQGPPAPPVTLLSDSTKQPSQLLTKKHLLPPKTIPVQKNRTVHPDAVREQATNVVQAPPTSEKVSNDSAAVVQTREKPRLRVSHINNYSETIGSTPDVPIKSNALRHFIRTRDQDGNSAIAVPGKFQHIIKSSITQN